MSRDLSEAVKLMLNRLKSSPALKKAYFPVPSTNVFDGFQERPFVAGEGYFRIRLTEMFLKDGREYWRMFLPFVLMVSEFSFDGKKCTVPVFAGKDLLKSIEKYIGDEAVDYRNTTMIGPTPYVDGDLSVFVGLFRNKTEDLADELIGLVNDVGRVFQIGELSQYLKLIAPLGRGVAAVLGIKDLEMRIGVRDEFAEKKLKTGYFALINCPERDVRPEQLWVKEGELWFGSGKPVQRLTSHDHCLLHYDFQPEREFSNLSFSKYWTDIKKMVWDAQESKAQATFLDLGRELAISPDLTAPHRFNLIRIYKANLEREIQLYRETRPNALDAPTGRRGNSVSTGGQDAIQVALSRIRDAGIFPGVERSVTALAGNWDTLTAPFPSKEAALDDKIIGLQLDALAASDPATGDSRELLDALTFAAMRE
jgi:hypothetical protein